ncbi:hypothetical protein [Chishuiella changwenlii]|uniref:hypothetical protein n=1 Tax=Chishuiella changwenlii TaxID=1434701 RepID=UPI002FD9A8F7
MNKIFTLIFSVLIFFSCNSEKEEKIENEETIVELVDFEEIAADTVLEPNYIAVFDEETGENSILTKKEIKTVSNLFEDSVDKYNAELKIKIEKENKEKGYNSSFEKEKINLRYYFRQYVVSVNKYGDKIVRVFGFCSYLGDWKKRLLMVHDGGDCYLNAEINLTKKKLEYFGTNGLG